MTKNDIPDSSYLRGVSSYVTHITRNEMNSWETALMDCRELPREIAALLIGRAEAQFVFVLCPYCQKKVLLTEKVDKFSGLMGNETSFHQKCLDAYQRKMDKERAKRQREIQRDKKRETKI